MGISSLDRGLRVLSEELLATGHQVHVAVPDDCVQDVIAKWGNQFVVIPIAKSIVPENIYSKAVLGDNTFYPIRGIYKLINDYVLAMYTPMFRGLSAYVSKNPPDLIIADVLALAAIDVAEKYDIKIVLNNPGLLTTLGGSNGVPGLGLGYSRQMTTTEKMVSYLQAKLLAFALVPIFVQINKNRWEAGLPPYRYPSEITSRHMTFVNTDFSLEIPRDVAPNEIMTGPLIPRMFNGLSCPEKDWLDRSPLPVVFVNVLHFSKEEIRAMSETLHSNLFNVWWSVMSNIKSFQGPTIDPISFHVGVNDNILSVLAHPKVSIVVIHCLLDVIQEALYFGHPIICVASTPEQLDIGARLVDSNSGIRIARNSKNKPAMSLARSINQAVITVLSQQNIASLAEKMGKKLQRTEGLNLAMASIRHVIHYGSKNFLSPLEPTYISKNAIDGMVFGLAVAFLLLIWTRYTIYLFVYVVHGITVRGVVVLKRLLTFFGPKSREHVQENKTMY